FDVRDLLGFVDGTENPIGPVASAAVLIGAEDPLFVGGSYVIVQKYLHDLQAWNALPVEAEPHDGPRRPRQHHKVSAPGPRLPVHPGVRRSLRRG
ncbi:MAG: Dyp-type peroxidase, partial [Pseudonocardiales bacterium]|nr:Dyp-type peroxidase [Pseudonocardiales bacterium]